MNKYLIAALLGGAAVTGVVLVGDLTGDAGAQTTRYYEQDEDIQLNATRATALANLIEAAAPGCVWKDGRFAKVTRAGVSVTVIYPKCEYEPASITDVPSGATLKIR